MNTVMKYLFLFSLLLTTSTSEGVYISYSSSTTTECDQEGKCNPHLQFTDSKCSEFGLPCLQTFHQLGEFDRCFGECVDPLAPFPTCADSCSTDDDCDTTNFEICGYNEREGKPLYTECKECVDDCLYSPYNCLSVDDCDIFKRINGAIEVECVHAPFSTNVRCGFCEQVTTTDTDTDPYAEPPYEYYYITSEPYETRAPCGCELEGADDCSAEGEGFICTAGKEVRLDRSTCPSCQHYCVQYLGGCLTDDDCAFDTEYYAFTLPMTCTRYWADDDCGHCAETCPTGKCNPDASQLDQCETGITGLICVQQPQSTHLLGPSHDYTQCIGVCQTPPEPCTDTCDAADGNGTTSCLDTEICAINYNNFDEGDYSREMQQCYECIDQCEYDYGCRVDADCEYETYTFTEYEVLMEMTAECEFDAATDECGWCNYIYVPLNTGVTDEPDDLQPPLDDVNETDPPNETEETVDPTECTDDIGTGFCWGKGTCKLTKRTLAADLLQVCKVCAEMDTGSCLCETVAETLLAIAKDQNLSFLGLSAGIQEKILQNCWNADDCSGIDAVTIVNADTCDCSALFCDGKLGGDESDKYLPGSSGNRIGIWMAAFVAFIFYVLS